MRKLSPAKAVIFIGAVALAGCATAAQRRAHLLGADLHAASSDLKTCVEVAWSDPKFNFIHEHAPLNTNDITILQMADNSKLSRNDAPVVSDLHSKIHQCRMVFLEKIGPDAPLLIPVLIQNFAESDQNTLDLVQDRLTWGEYVTNSKRIGANTQIKFSEALRQTDQQLAAENQAELAQRQQAAESMMQSYQNQQLINSINRPVITNCSSFGSTTNCFSR